MNSIFRNTLCSLILLGGLQTVEAQSPRNTLIRDGNQANIGSGSGERTVAGSSFGYFLSAKKETPEKQLAYAEDLEEQGRLKKASKAYRALVKIWPNTREAGMAQYHYARLLEDIKNPLKAAEAYEYLFTYYTGSFPHEVALQRLFNLGLELLNEPKGKFLIFPGFDAPERSIPLFENIIQFGPRWERAAEAQFLIGQAHQRNLNYEQAITAYETALMKYAKTPWAEQGAYYMVQCYYEISNETPNNQASLKEAWIATVLFKQQFPESEYLPAIEAYQETLLRRRASLAFEKARYYDEISFRPKAALRSYKEFVKTYPTSEWASIARTRILALEAMNQEAKGE